MTLTGSAVAPGVRTTCPSVRTTSSAEASRSSWLPSNTRNNLDAQTAAHERGTPGASVHIGRDPVKRKLEGGIRYRESWEHLRAEHAGADAAEPTQRPEAVACTAGGCNRTAPVGMDAELICGEHVGRRARDELDGLAGAFLEERLELRDGLAPRQTADVDSGNLGTRRELAPRARESEADQDGERRNGNENADHDGGRRTPAPTSRRGVHTEATRRASKREF